jgi:hypothetical protein
MHQQANIKATVKRHSGSNPVAFFSGLRTSYCHLHGGVWQDVLSGKVLNP